MTYEQKTIVDMSDLAYELEMREVEKGDIANIEDWLAHERSHMEVHLDLEDLKDFFNEESKAPQALMDFAKDNKIENSFLLIRD